MRKLLPTALAGLVLAALWWRRNPSPCPFGQRWVLKIPRPVINPENLIEILDLKPDQDVLEIGPGAGYYALPVARHLSSGKLSLLDIQQEMLDFVGQEAAAEGLKNIDAALASAEKLPYPDDSFDAIYLVTVLGEIPDRAAALREIARVLRPAGCVVFGEIFGDPHMVTLSRLRLEAAGSGLHFERKLGNSLSFFARFGLEALDDSQ